MRRIDIQPLKDLVQVLLVLSLRTQRMALLVQLQEASCQRCRQAKIVLQSNHAALLVRAIVVGVRVVGRLNRDDDERETNEHRDHVHVRSAKRSHTDRRVCHLVMLGSASPLRLQCVAFAANASCIRLFLASLAHTSVTASESHRAEQNENCRVRHRAGEGKTSRRTRERAC